MATDCIQNNKQNRGSAARTAARSAFFVICAAGVFLVLRVALNFDLEWRLLAMAALAFAFGPLRVEIGDQRDRSLIRFPLVHCVLFASALTLGPIGAALPGAFGGLGRIMFGASERRPLYSLLYLIAKPAAISVAASAVYTAAGGSIFRPHGVDAFAAVLASGLAYVAAGAIITYIAAEAIEEKPGNAVGLVIVISAWSVLLAGGYMLAVVYALAPAYVLLVPLLVTGLVRTATIRTVHVDQGLNKEKQPESDSTDYNLAVKDEGFVDELTGFANQRYLSMFLGRELSRAERYHSPLSLAIFDVDCFKKISEDIGNANSDRMLVEIGQRLRAGLRDYDLVGRFSAGRFAVVLPEASSQTALEVCERLHASVIDIIIGEKPISVSVGIATFPDHANSVEELINSAHHALNVGRFNKSNNIYIYSIRQEAA